MKTDSNINLAQVNTKPTLKCKRFIVDPITGKGIPNPNWTEEQEKQIIALTKPKKILFRLTAPLDKIRKCQRKKELPAIFKGKLTPKQALDKLDEYAEAGQNAKINSIGYLTYLVVIRKFKKLFPSQGHMAKVIHISRGWENETLSAIQEDGLIDSVFRFLCTKCYSISAALLDPEFRDRFAKHFPWIKYYANKAAVAEFTYNINLTINKLDILDNLTLCKKDNDPKREIPSKFSSEQEKTRNFLTSITSVLCSKMKAF
jgi:hypothetical protein